MIVRSPPGWSELLAQARRLVSDEAVAARDLVRLAETLIRKADVWCANSYGTPRADARAAVFHVLAVPDHHDEYLDARVTPLEAQTILDLLEKRLTSRVPLPWLTGEAFHAGRRFLIDPGVFVPRGHLNRVLAKALEAVPPGGRVLELCAGCGALGILAALQRADLTVDAVDISPDAVANAERNVALYRLGARLRVSRGDLYDGADGRYHLIIAHPPYVPERAGDGTDEPHEALYSGEDGLELARRIVAGAPAHLEPGGQVLLELGADQQRLDGLAGVTWWDVPGVCSFAPTPLPSGRTRRSRQGTAAVVSQP